MEEFKKYKFGDIVNILDSKRIPLSATQRENRKGIYPYYGAQGIIDYIDDYIFDGTYLLIAEDGENLKSQKNNIAQIAIGKYWVNNHAHIVESNGSCDIRYICYLLNKIDISGYITGSAQPKLNQANLQSIELSLPSLTVQKRIADYIDLFDSKISLNRRINDNLEQQAQALFKSWFVDFEPFKDGKFVDSEMGMIPEGWKVGKLEDIADVVGGGTPSKANALYFDKQCIPWITPKDLSIKKTKFISKGEIDITEEGYKNSSAKKIPLGSVLFSSRAPIGYISIAENELTTNQGFKSVVPVKAGTSFLYLYLKANTKAIEAQATGSTFKEASGSLMKSLCVIIPPDTVFDSFERNAFPFFSAQANVEREIVNLSKARDTLLPRLMSGELKINDLNC